MERNLSFGNNILTYSMQLPQAYIKVKEIDTRLGKVILYSNPTRTLLYAEASGYISLGLLKQDLAFVSDFDQSQMQPWTYLVNTAQIGFAHPLNPFHLNQLKVKNHLKQYIVYIPSHVLRFINRSFRGLIPINLMLKSEQDLLTILNEHALLKD
tara:strand:- start:185 stop:646 length:462 start_codon:yes stop_codon:yes gene_type:complete